MLGLGSLYRFRKQPIKFLQTMGERFGDLASFKLGPFNAVLVNHPELIRDVLATRRECFPKHSRQAKTIRLIDGNSLFVRQGDQWMQQRKLVQSAIHLNQMPRFFDIIVEEVDSMCRQMNSGNQINFCDTTMDLAIRISGRMLLGTDLSERCEQLRQVAKSRADVFVKETGMPFRVPDHWPLPSKKKKRFVIETMDDLLYSLIEEKRKSPGEDLISVLLQPNELNLSDRDIRDHANMIFHAGVDDVSSAMAWMFYLVAKHRDVQERIRSECDDVFGDGSFAAQQLGKLEYVNAVVKETLRLYPSTWLFAARKATQDVQLKDHLIKKRTWVFVSPMVTQRDSRFFDDANQFDPNRFLRYPGGSQTNDAWFPFGIGPRACAGGRLSLMTLALTLVGVIRKFDLREAGASNVTPVAKVTVRPSTDILVELEDLKQSTQAA